MKVREHAGAEAIGAGLEFEDFFRAEYLRLVRALFLLTSDRAEAEDLAQEAMARVVERWDRLRDLASPTGYLYRVAMNLHRNRLRSLRVRARRAAIASDLRDDAETASETHADVMRALSKLAEPDRQILVLAEWLHMSSEESGRVLGIAPSSARARLSRARSRLRDLLGEGYAADH